MCGRTSSLLWLNVIPLGDGPHLFVHSAFDGFGSVSPFCCCEPAYTIVYLHPCFQQFGVQTPMCFLAPESGEGRLPLAELHVGTGNVSLCRVCCAFCPHLLCLWLPRGLLFLASDHPGGEEEELSPLLCSPGLEAPALAPLGAPGFTGTWSGCCGRACSITGFDLSPPSRGDAGASPDLAPLRGWASHPHISLLKVLSSPSSLHSLHHRPINLRDRGLR